MYESHFGFSGSPFQLNPDPAFYFDSRGHSNALSYLKFGAHQGEGFIVVTGEIGAGKTTLVRTLLAGLDPNQVVAAQVVSTQLESGELLQAILMSFGIASASSSKAHLIGALEAFLTALAAHGKRALLIIDEAQNLSHGAVEELRMLSNFQLGSHGLLQSFLVGQPELRKLLQSKTMEQLRQRVIASCHLGPLAEPETRAYVEHRLRRVGWSERPQFSPESFDQIHHWSGGVPRKINRLCNRLLLGAFLQNEDQISASMVERTAIELRNEIGEVSELPEVHEPPPSLSPRKRAGGNEEFAAGAGESPAVELPAIPSKSPVPVPVPAPAPAPALALALAPAGRRAGVKLVSGARATAGATLASAASVNEAAAAPEAIRIDPVGTEANAIFVKEDEAPVANTLPPQVSVPALLSVIPGQERSGVPAALPSNWTSAGIEAEVFVQRHQYGEGSLTHPIFCLGETSADFLKAGTLNHAICKHRGLPKIVAVQINSATEFEFGGALGRGLQMPLAGLYIEGLEASYAKQIPTVIRLFDDMLSEFKPVAMMVMGSSDAILTCCQLAKKQGITLIRVAGGRRNAAGEDDRRTNSALIDRLCDSLFLNSQDDHFTLFHEGMRSKRLHTVGSLVGEMLQAVLPHLPKVADMLGALPGPGATRHGANGYALACVAPRGQFQADEAVRLLVDLLCEAAQDLPIVWLVDQDARARYVAPDMEDRLIDAGVVLCNASGYLQHLSLLKSARCLIAGPDASLVEEADFWQIPALALRHDVSTASLHASGVLGGTVCPEGNSPLKVIRQRLIASRLDVTPATNHWDSGAAAQMAKDLSIWLPKALGNGFGSAP